MVAVFAIAVGAAARGSSSSPVSVSVTVSHNALRYHKAHGTLTIELTTGAAAEDDVMLGIQTPTWPDPRVGGSTLYISHEAVSGRGKIIGHGVSSEGYPTDYNGTCDRGGNAGSSPELSLPAHSTTTLTYRVRLSRPPWPGESLKVALSLSVIHRVGDTTIAQSYEAPSTHFTAGAPSGVEMRLSSPNARGRHYEGVRAGSSVTITGTTRPRLTHARIAIGYRRLDGSRRQRGLIGIVRTNKRGEFHADWKSVPSGIWGITARNLDTRPGVLRDVACNLTVGAR
jgi:hypothetical protein